MRPGVGPALLFVAAAAGVALTQPPLARTVHAAGQREDTYALPPPAHLHAATLGWDAAAVDLIWTQLLVQFGTHWSEHREFTDTGRYADAIIELEPSYRPLYRYLDTMLAYRPLQGTEADVRAARAYLERGTRERPEDAALWLEYGQFLAFIAPTFLASPAEQDAWRLAGGEAIGRAVELGADAERSMAAASLLGRSGQTEAATRYLEQAYAFTEHPSMAAVHEKIGQRLLALKATALRDAADEVTRSIAARWNKEMPYLSWEQYLLLGPVVDWRRCTGLRGADDPSCARDFAGAP